MPSNEGANGTVASKAVLRHPLDQLTAGEVDIAREAVLKARQCPLFFRNIYNLEPVKAQLLKYLEAEHAGTLTAETPRPPRRAVVQYDVVSEDKLRHYMESNVDLTTGEELTSRVLEKGQQQSITIDEFIEFNDACLKSPMFLEAMEEFELPEGFEVAIDPWPYGGPDPDEDVPRITQGLCFAKDVSKGNPDSNHYGFPLPIIPVMDTYKKEIIRIDRLATGGKEDGLAYGTHTTKPLEHCQSAEYVPELLDTPMRSDLKPLNVVQPEGASFTITNESLIEWQKWRFRLSFTPRECAVLHDIHYDGRSILHRLSISEMTVPYGDPRPPYHRKQAFDFGDAGAGRAANNLGLGCDCLGAIKYVDALLVDTQGKPSISKNVVCIHEQDDGILWKHTNYRTNRAVVVRNRELVIQFIITLANYEYIFAYKFDLAGGISVETRATGIVSVVNIDPGKTSPYGNIVSAGAMAQNHQHIFAVRIDPAIDGQNNTVTTEESLPMPMEPKTNPFGNGYKVVSTPILKSTSIDASPMTNRIIKMSNPSKPNPVSGKPVSYKFTPAATQLMLADPNSVAAQRARFAAHHVWVTKHQDYEFWAGGEFTNQSSLERGGCYDAAARNDDVEDADVVVWNVFALTHNPRVEDWPVMPMEKHELHLRPSDFFTANPAIDVPSNRNLASVQILTDQGSCCATGANVTPLSSDSNGNGVNGAANGSGDVQRDSRSHLQGTGTIHVNTNGHHHVH